MDSGCGTSRRTSLRTSVSPASSVTKANSSTTGEVEIPSITEQPTERRDEPGSDHRPVVSVFDLG